MPIEMAGDTNLKARPSHFTASRFRPSRSSEDPAHVDHEARVLRRMRPRNRDTASIVGSGRLVVSTRCGHVFCSQCLRDSLTSSHTCPTCRKRLTHRQYHPLYI